MELPPPSRLSIILPIRIGRGDRAWAELALQSVLEQPDPIGAELIVVDDDPEGSNADYLKSIYAEAYRSGRLTLALAERSTGDLGALKNQGAEIAQGAYLAFLHAGDTWNEAGLRLLQPLLYGNDLILAGVHGELPRASAAGDAVRALLESKRPAKSSMIILRTLFDEVGGYSRGYTGKILPSRIPGDENLELWLKALAKLQTSGRRERFVWVENRYIRLGMLEGGAGDTAGIPPALIRLTEGLDQFKSTVSWIKAARALPKEYWPLMGRKAAKTVTERVVGQVTEKWKASRRARKTKRKEK